MSQLMIMAYQISSSHIKTTVMQHNVNFFMAEEEADRCGQTNFTQESHILAQEVQVHNC